MGGLDQARCDTMSPLSTNYATDAVDDDFVVVPLAGDVIGELETRYDAAAQSTTGGNADSDSTQPSIPPPAPPVDPAAATTAPITQTQTTSLPMVRGMPGW